MKFQCFHAIKFSEKSPTVDRENGVIRGAAIMSIGAAKGHGVLIDATTLEQVMAAAQKYSSGMPVKFNPQTFDHGPGGYVGTVPNDSLSIDKEAGVLRGDIKVLKSFPNAEYVYDLAENQPDTFGNSLEFEGEPEDIGGAMFSRCSELYGVMLVDQPAANATGFFRSKEDPANPAKKKKKMTDEDMQAYKAMLSEAIAPMATTVAELKTGYADLSTKFTALASKSKDDEDPDTEDMSSEDVAAEQMEAGVAVGESKLSANRKVNAFRKNRAKAATVGDLENAVGRQLTKLFRNAGGRPVSVSNQGGHDGHPGAFMGRVEKLVEGGMSKANAMATAVATSKKNGNDYQEYRKKQLAIHMSGGAK